MFKAPALWFPSTSLFIDDDSLFIKLLIENLQIADAKYLENPKLLLKDKSGDLVFYKNKNQILSYDIEHIRKNLKNIPKEANLISVIISDLHMPTISGWDLFGEIESIFASKILMSGFIKQQIQSLTKVEKHVNIDFFLDKSENFNVELLLAIKKAKLKFFTNFSNLLFNDIPNSHPLADHGFAKLFIEEIEKFKPDEILPSNNFTKFTFKNFTTKIIRSITTADEKEISSQINSVLAESAPETVIEYLSKGQYILCYKDDSEEDMIPEGNLWPLYIRPAQVFFASKQKIFYNISDEPMNND